MVKKITLAMPRLINLIAPENNEHHWPNFSNNPANQN